MPETLQLKIAGLFTNPNTLGDTVPPGALATADDIVIDRDQIADCRRGQNKYGLLTNVPDKEFAYQDTLLVHFGFNLAYDSDGNGTFVNYTGSFDQPTPNAKVRSMEANRNLYLTSASGIRKLDAVTNQFRNSGGIEALFGTATLSNPGFMSNQVQVAYRMVWGYTDANGNEIVGVPSQRVVVINNTGLTANVNLKFYIPSLITTSYFYRVYRSGESAGVAFPPDDELQQVKEGTLTSTDISNGYFTFTDIVPNNLRGASLYTDPSQEGILQANYPPPLAIDMCLFRNIAWYFNTTSKQRYFTNLTSVGDNTTGGQFGYQTNNGTTHTNTTIDGLSKAASIVIQDLTYTAVSAGVAGNNITITYIIGGTAGSEVVTVSASNITVKIQSGVSTATQVKAAVDGFPAAAALVSVAISGGGSNAQVAQAITFLSDGFDTTYLNIGMRIVGTGVTTGTTIATISGINSITTSIATTASATVPLEFQDLFAINNMVYWGGSSADYPNRQFQVQLSGTPGENIDQTAQNLVAAIDLDPNNSLVYAYYTSDASELPGSILLEERGIGASAFSITSSNGKSFSPVLPSSGSSQISDNEAHQNRVMFSKSLQPEAVPLVNFLSIGSENYAIIRALAIRDSIFIFKEVEGIFRITGTDSSNFQVSLFDSSARIRAPESAVILNNQVFTYSDQGVIAVSENGVQILSRPIETTLLELSSDLFPFFENSVFGVSYETDRKYLLFVPTSENDPYPTQAFVFNTITNTWFRWNMTRSCGLVLSTDNKLYMGNPDDLYIYKERKHYDRTDFADTELDVQISSASGDIVYVGGPPFSIGTNSLFNTNSVIGVPLNLMVSVFQISTVIVSNYSWKDALGNIKDESNFATSAGWSEVTTAANITFNGTAVIDKTVFGYETGGIFRNTQTTAQVGDQIEFQFQFSADVTDFIIVLSDEENIVQFGNYRVGIESYKFSGSYWITIRDDGTNDDAGITNVLANVLYRVVLTVLIDGTISVDVSVVSDPLTQDVTGWLLKQGGAEANILSVQGQTQLTVDSIQTWTAGTATIFQPIAARVAWVPNTASNSGILKHYSESTVFFRDASFNSIDVGFQTNLKNSFEDVTLPAPPALGWGFGTWGEFPWGLSSGQPFPIRTLVPLEMARASWLNFRVTNTEAFSSFSLAGVSTQYTEMSPRQR